MIAAVVLAAGEGRRFGGLKQLHPIEGTPMLERVLTVVEHAGVDDRVVVLGAQADRVRDGIPLHGARVVVGDRWRDGQAASLRAGLAALGDETDAALVVLGDGPRLDPTAVDRLLAAHRRWPDQVLAADYGAGRSHPVVLPRSAWARLPERGEGPGRTLPAQMVDCSDLAPPGDVDYPT